MTMSLFKEKRIVLPASAGNLSFHFNCFVSKMSSTFSVYVEKDF